MMMMMMMMMIVVVMMMVADGAYCVGVGMGEWAAGWLAGGCCAHVCSMARQQEVWVCYGQPVVCVCVGGVHMCVCVCGVWVHMCGAGGGVHMSVCFHWKLSNYPTLAVPQPWLCR
jgi:hypothetical protein